MKLSHVGYNMKSSLFRNTTLCW